MHIKRLLLQVKKRRTFPSSITVVPGFGGPSSYGANWREFLLFLINKTRHAATKPSRHTEDNHSFRVLTAQERVINQLFFEHITKNQSFSSDLNIVSVSEFKVLNNKLVALLCFIYKG